MNPRNTQTPHYSHINRGTQPTHDFRDLRPIKWRKYLFIYLHNWYWFLVTLGIALGVAFFKNRYSIPQFQASATLIIEQEDNSQDMVSQLRAVRYMRRQADLADETAKLSSFSTVKRAIDSVKQDIFWTGHGRIRVKPLYKSQRFDLILLNDSVNWHMDIEWYVDYVDNESFRLYQGESIDTILPLNSVIDLNGWIFSTCLHLKGSYDSYSFTINDQITLTKKYKNKLKVKYDETQGSTITLLSEGPVGEREVDFLNTLSSIYILSELERKQTIAGNTFAFIDDQIKIILDSLQKSEAQLLTFRLSNNVINLSREGEIAFERLKAFNDQRTSLKLQEDYYNYLKRYIEERNDPQTIIAPTLMGEGDQLLINAVKNLQELYMERETLELSVRENNPSIESINTRISGIRIRIIEIVKGLIENNSLIQEQIKTEEKAIIDQLKSLPINEQQLLNIKRKYDLYNQFYTFLLEKRAEAGIQKASTISNVRILDPARYDQLTPVGSDKRIIIIISLLLGISIPGVVLILKDLLDNRIREKDDIELKTDIPIIGLLGHASQSNAVLSKEKASAIFIESLRRIRTNLSFALRDKDEKVIMITSSVSGEGKSFTAVNLATIIAMNRRKVLILGCDMRKPSLHKMFNLSNDFGITSYIIGEKAAEDIILPTSTKDLFVALAGPVPPNPAELIETIEMQEFINHAKRNFDYIIIDTPPIALVADALALANYADLTLYLVRQNHSYKGVLELANSLRDEEKLPKTYILINDIQPSKSFGFNYYYGYGKSYHEGYYGSS